MNLFVTDKNAMGQSAALYEALIEAIPDTLRISRACRGPSWTAVETEEGLGLAMSESPDGRPPQGRMEQTETLKELACAVFSWNLAEAALGMAAINCYYNTPARLHALNWAQGDRSYCTRGLDLSGRHIGVVGHMLPREPLFDAAEDFMVFERRLKDGDYPDAAEPYLLASRDLLIVTASSLANKTLPHLVALAEGRALILAGPSAPMAPQLFDFGIGRLAGLIITRKEEAFSFAKNMKGGPYAFGERFLRSSPQFLKMTGARDGKNPP